MDWYPAATQRPISHNYTPGRAGRAVQLIVDHIADGYGSPGPAPHGSGWFDRDAGEDGSSAPFWISRTGLVEQYRPLSDTCWANGPKCNPDLSNPIIAAAVKNALVGMNSISVAIEHEGKPGEPLTAVQVAESRKLHRWLSEQLGVPLDRTHVVGHYQIDRCTRANCPGPTFPWEAILSEPKTPAGQAPAFDLRAELDQLWKTGELFEKSGYPWTGQGIKALVAVRKGEK